MKERAAGAVAALSLVLWAGSALAQDAAGLRVAAVPPEKGAPGVPGMPHRPPRSIAVSGEGKVSVAPDSASFTVGVESTAKTVAAASAEVNARMKAVLDAVAQAGVASKDVRTVRYDVSIDRPWKDGKQQPIAGYRVSTAADVKVRELPKLGKILDAVTAAGSNQLQSLRMERLDPKPQQLEALALAYAGAREKARAIAIAAGVELGDFFTVSEGGASPRPMGMPMLARSMAADSAPAPVAEGELEYGARVEVVFGVK
jgi:uncharacterized protein YggE